jgi:anti-sigma B factor antagonist
VSTTPSPFELRVLPERAFVRVRPRGEVDLATAGRLDGQLRELWEAGWAEVIADLRDVTFMDSTGLHVLVTHHRHAAERGLRFSIIDGGAPVSRVLKLTGLDQVFDRTPADRVE